MHAEDGSRREDPLRYRHGVMGTMCSLRVHDAVPVATIDTAAASVFAELEDIERLFSTFRPDSQISRVNRGELELLECDRKVIEVLDACTWLEHTSGGAFSIRRPDRPDIIDPAGFVKGWAVERAAGALRAAGLRHWWLGVGGDVVVHGSPTLRRPWQVAIADPLDDGAILGVIDLADAAVATSGTAERGPHVWDGRNGRAAEALTSLTVVGPSLTWADAFATAGFAMGRRGPEWVARFDDYHALAVTAAGDLLTSDAFVLEPIASPSA
jgi:thiamine biosynthesis lipoprotein